MFQTKVVEKIETHFYVQRRFISFENIAVYEAIKKYGRSGQPQITIWRMRIACCIAKTANTLSDYVIFIACLLQQWSHERASVLRFRTLPVLCSLFLVSRTGSSVGWKVKILSQPCYRQERWPM